MNIKNQSQLKLNQGNGLSIMVEKSRVIRPISPCITAQEVKVRLQTHVQTTLDRMLVSPPSIETADPLNWWNLYAFGPIQPDVRIVSPTGFTPDLLLPHLAIRKGEEAFVAAVLILNPIGPAAPSALDILSNFAPSYEVTYATGELKEWKHGPVSLQHVSKGHLEPGQPFYVDVFSFIPKEVGLYETNICSRILGCHGITALPFAGFATWVLDPHDDFLADLLGLYGEPSFCHRNPIRFQVYE